MSNDELIFWKEKAEYYRKQCDDVTRKLRRNIIMELDHATAFLDKNDDGTITVRLDGRGPTVIADRQQLIELAFNFNQLQLNKERNE